MHVFIKDKGVHGGKKHVTQYAPKKKIQYIYIYIYITIFTLLPLPSKMFASLYLH